MHHVLIVGGGISGLAAAYFLEKQAAEAGVDILIDLVEKRDRIGGVIVSELTDGFLLEGGPDSFLTQKTAAIDLCRSLGLADQLIPSNDTQRKTYILQGGELKELPDGLMFMLPTRISPILGSSLFSASGKIRLALSPLFSPPIEKEDVSVAEFISKRLGRQALDRLAEPLLSAVYGADVNTLSAHAVLERFVRMEETYGSIWKAVRAMERTKASQPGGDAPAGSIFVSLRGGVGQLVNALEKILTKNGKTRFVRGMEVTNVSRARSGFRVRARAGKANLEAAPAAVILAIPAHAAASALEKMDAPLAARLQEIPYHSTMTVSMAFEEGAFSRPLDGFGFVVARQEGRRLVACTWVSTKFPFRCPPGRVLIRGFLGGSRDPDVMVESDAAILQTVLNELTEIMALRRGIQPVFSRIHRWDRAMPQYVVGHPGRVDDIMTKLAAHPGVSLAGNGYRGIGIPDCIDSAVQAASATIAYLRSLE